MRAVAWSLLWLPGLPLLGLPWIEKPAADFLSFPPLTRAVQHPAFSWPVFIVLALVIAAVTTPFIWRLVTTSPVPAAPPRRPLPWWGWVALLWIAGWWSFAWTRWTWFQPLQPYTFTPLWLGYIVLINAWTERRSGVCLLRQRPLSLLRLFAASAVFWWSFEYFNRFAENWYYVGAEGMTPGEYVLHGSVSFSTVLPAVISTIEWLRSFPRLDAAFQHVAPLRVAHPRRVAALCLCLASIGLATLGIWPQVLFPLLWTAPLIVVTSLQVLLGEPTILSTIPSGDWRPVWLPALAGLWCGLFWELWNVKSLAHWEYAIPYVHRFLIFEMPMLGYAGYLPFGMECKVVSDLLKDDVAMPSNR